MQLVNVEENLGFENENKSYAYFIYGDSKIGLFNKNCSKYVFKVDLVKNLKFKVGNFKIAVSFDKPFELKIKELDRFRINQFQINPFTFKSVAAYSNVSVFLKTIHDYELSLKYDYKLQGNNVNIQTINFNLRYDLQCTHTLRLKKLSFMPYVNFLFKNRLYGKNSNNQALNAELSSITNIFDVVTARYNSDLFKIGSNIILGSYKNILLDFAFLMNDAIMNDRSNYILFSLEYFLNLSYFKTSFFLGREKYLNFIYGNDFLEILILISDQNVFISQIKFVMNKNFDFGLRCKKGFYKAGEVREDFKELRLFITYKTRCWKFSFNYSYVEKNPIDPIYCNFWGFQISANGADQFLKLKKILKDIPRDEIFAEYI